MYQPSTSRQPFVPWGGDSGSDGGGNVDAYAHDDSSNVREVVQLSKVDEYQSSALISESTVVDGVDANAITLQGEDQRFTCVELSMDWSLVVTITSDGALTLWNATNEFVLVGSTRFEQGRRTLKCTAFHPYDEKAMLLCFDSGEVFCINHGELQIACRPSSVRAPGILYMELVYQCEGRSTSLFDYFTFSSDRKMMVYYNLDGEFVAVRFLEQGGTIWTSLSKDFQLKQNPSIVIVGQSILATSVMKPSENRESPVERLEALFWSKLDFKYPEAKNKPVELEGKGYLSSDGQYVLVSTLYTKDQSTFCQIKVCCAEVEKTYHPIDPFFGLSESDTSWDNTMVEVCMKHDPIATKILSFVSNHPHLESLDRNQFKSLHAHDGNVKPLVAILQTDSVGSRLVFWDTHFNALVYEIDLTLNKGLRRFSVVKYCWSSDHKWLGVCSVGTKMIGLACARSGVFVWTTHVRQIGREDTGSCALRFDPSTTRLMIHLGKAVFCFEPPCLSKRPQRHPTRDKIRLSKTSRDYSDFDILEMAKEWPKYVLFNVLLRGSRAKPEYQQFLLDAAISSTSERLVVLCKTYKGHCFLSIVNYNKTSSWRTLWLVVMSRWNQCCISNDISSSIKKISGDRANEGLSVFCYHNEKTCNEQIVLLSSEAGVEILDLDLNLKELSEWTILIDERSLSLTQSKDRHRVISLTDRHVFVINLNAKSIVKRVTYSFGLSQWYEVFVERVKFFAYSYYNNIIGQESVEAHKPFLPHKLQGLFDISDNGRMILIGWDSEQNKSLFLTPDKSEEQFRTEWDEAHESLYQCSMLTENGDWLGFIDYEKLRSGDIVVCVVNIANNNRQRIWLGSNERLAKPCSDSKGHITSFFLQFDEAKEKLTTLELKDIGLRNKIEDFFVRLVHDAEGGKDDQSLLEYMTQPTNMDRYVESKQPFVFNMNVAAISNFQRVLVEEGEEKMEKVAKSASNNKIKLSNIYRFCQDTEHDHTTFLTHTLKKKETALVQLCLRFIESGLFTFHSASDMVKVSFFELLFYYNESILPILKRNSLTFKVAEIRVPAQVFKSLGAITHVAFTSNTLFETNDHFVKMATEDLQQSKSGKPFGWTRDHKDGRKVLSCVSFHLIADACKIGLNGIVRKLLMLEVDESIFKTELICATVTWKWEKLWKRRCLRQIYFYIVFLAFFTFYAVGIGTSGDSLVRDKRVGLGVSFPLLVALIITIVFFFDECMQFKTYIMDGKEVFGTYKWGIKHYFLDSQWNVLELASYFLVLVLIPIFHTMYLFEVCSKTSLFVMVAIESILAWFKLWYYAQPFDQTGALVLLISSVIHDCYPFLLLSLVVLIGFSVALYVLFQCVSNPPYANSMEEDENLIHESFGSPWRSLSTLFYAMVGTFEVEVYYNHKSLPWLTTSIFILYMGLEMIVMLNMLIAIMGDTFDRVKNEEDVQIIIGRARFIDAYEASLSARQIRDVERKIGKFLYVLTPKTSSYAKRKTNWKGKINVIEENVKKVIVDNKKEIEDKIQERFQKIELVLEKTLHEHKQMLEEYQSAIVRKSKNQEENLSKNQDLLLSIAERIKALETEVNRPTSTSDDRFAREEQRLHKCSLVQDDMA